MLACYDKNMYKLPKERVKLLDKKFQKVYDSSSYANCRLNLRNHESENKD